MYECDNWNNDNDIDDDNAIEDIDKIENSCIWTLTIMIFGIVWLTIMICTCYLQCFLILCLFRLSFPVMFKLHIVQL